MSKNFENSLRESFVRKGIFEIKLDFPKTPFLRLEMKRPREEVNQEQDNHDSTDKPAAILARLEYVESYCKIAHVGLFQKEKLFPNIKEVTESYGMFYACLVLAETFEISRSDPKVLIVVIGDGHRARTGVICSCLSAWKAVSIDPCISECPSFPKVRTIKAKIEDLTLEQEIDHDGPVLLCFPHSHASLAVSLTKIRSKTNQRHLVNMPCCVKPDLPQGPDFTYTDDQVLSEKNKIDLYFNV